MAFATWLYPESVHCKVVRGGLHEQNGGLWKGTTIKSPVRLAGVSSYGWDLGGREKPLPSSFVLLPFSVGSMSLARGSVPPNTL